MPSTIARALLPQLERGEVRRGWLGVSIQGRPPELAEALGVKALQGAVVADVTDGTPAERAGLRADDVVVALDGEPVTGSRELTRVIGFRAPGETVALTVLRDGRRREPEVRLGERPDLEGVRGPRRVAPAEEEQTGRLGLTVRDPDGRNPALPRHGALVVHVEPGSLAEEAGLRPGMVIVEAGGEPVRSARELMRLISRADAGRNLLLWIQMGQGRLLRALPIP